MSFSQNPLALPVSEIGVTPHHFLRPTPLHGPSHVNRVIYHGMHLARLMGWNDIMPAVWAACHLHDQARLSDGVCHEHGAAAVRYQLAKMLSLYARGGLAPSMLPHVVTAVASHCIREELPKDHPHYRVTAVLKDADALDRVRIGDLDPSYLRLERSPLLVDSAQTLFERFGNDVTVKFEDVWKFGVATSNPLQGISDRLPLHYDPTETPEDRCSRRLNAAANLRRALPDIYRQANRTLDLAFWEPTATAEFAFINFLQRHSIAPAAAVDRLASDVRSIAADLRPIAARLIPITCTNKRAEFERDGRYKSFWETGATWHKKYGDAPEDTRAYFDQLLYGEKGAHLTHGILLDPESPETDYQLTQLRESYGSDVLIWKRDILSGCSFSVNDSMAAKKPVVVRYSPENILKSAIALRMIKRGVPLPTALFPWAHRFDFWEFQAHLELTPTHLEQSIPHPALSNLKPITQKDHVHH